MDYIERLAQIREEKSLPLATVAKQLDMPEQYLALIELGEIIPTETQMEAITEFVINHTA